MIISSRLFFLRHKDKPFLNIYIYIFNLYKIVFIIIGGLQNQPYPLNNVTKLY